MADISIYRISKEIKDIKKNDNEDQYAVSFGLINNDNLRKLLGRIIGPPETPYEKGLFNLEIEIPENYPFIAPNIKFITKIWHPNISSVTGAICLDILADNWQSSYTIKSTLFSIQALLSSPEPYSPQDAIVAEQFLINNILFKETAKYWTSIYAEGPARIFEMENKTNILVNMGFNKNKIIQFLSSNYWDLDYAIEEFINN